MPRRVIPVLIAAAVVAMPARCEPLDAPISFSSFADVSAGAGEDPVETQALPVERMSIASAPRLYVSVSAGSCFATLSQPDVPQGPAIGNQTLMTGGGALGVAFDRPSGWLRLEVEGLARETMSSVQSNPGAGTSKEQATDGWSTMVNLWRDVPLTERLGIYAGGGIGGGGYRYVFSGNVDGADLSGTTGIRSFAWQAGGGAAFALSERVALDLGYRFFSLDAGAANLYVTAFGDTTVDTRLTQFSASELLLTLRVYEPFRNWR